MDLDAFGGCSPTTARRSWRAAERLRDRRRRPARARRAAAPYGARADRSPRPRCPRRRCAPRPRSPSSATDAAPDVLHARRPRAGHPAARSPRTGPPGSAFAAPASVDRPRLRHRRRPGRARPRRAHLRRASTSTRCGSPSPRPTSPRSGCRARCRSPTRPRSTTPASTSRSPTPRGARRRGRMFDVDDWTPPWSFVECAAAPRRVREGRARASRTPWSPTASRPSG